MKLALGAFMLCIVLASAATAIDSEAAKIGDSGDILEIGEQIGEVSETFTDGDLDALRAGTITTSKGTTNFTQTLDLSVMATTAPNHGAVILDENNDNETGLFLFFNDGQPIFKYTINFTEGLASDLANIRATTIEDTSISMMGKQFAIARTSVNAGSIVLELWENELSDTLLEGETRTYTIGGAVYEVTVVRQETNGILNASFIINGEATPIIDEDVTYTLVDGLVLGMIDAFNNTLNDSIQLGATFALGIGNEFRIWERSPGIPGDNDSLITVQGENVENLQANINANVNASDIVINSIDFTLFANTANQADIYLVEGDGLRASLNEQEGMIASDWDLIFEGLFQYEFFGGLTQTPQVTGIEFNPQGDSNYDLTFTNRRGDTFTVPYADAEANLFGERTTTVTEETANDTLAQGETRTHTLLDTDYEVTVLVINQNGSVKFLVNGAVTSNIGANESVPILDTVLRVHSVEWAGGAQQYIVTFSITKTVTNTQDTRFIFFEQYQGINPILVGDYFVLTDVGNATSTDDSDDTGILQFLSVNETDNTISFADISDGAVIETSYTPLTNLSQNVTGTITLYGKDFDFIIHRNVSGNYNLFVDMDRNGVMQPKVVDIVTRGGGILTPAVGEAGYDGQWKAKLRTLDNNVDSDVDQIVNITFMELNDELDVSLPTIAGIDTSGTWLYQQIAGEDRAVAVDRYGAWFDITTEANEADSLSISYPESQVEAFVFVVFEDTQASIIDTTPPNVTITSPNPGQVVSGVTTINVAAADDDIVDVVSLVIDGVAIGFIFAEPFTFSWDTTSYSNGQHTILVGATDRTGNYAEDSITASVNNVVQTSRRSGGGGGGSGYRPQAVVQQNNNSNETVQPEAQEQEKPQEEIAPEPVETQGQEPVKQPPAPPTNPPGITGAATAIDSGDGINLFSAIGDAISTAWSWLVGLF